jgi:hypothetical protein
VLIIMCKNPFVVTFWLVSFGRVGISDSILIYNFSHPRV